MVSYFKLFKTVFFLGEKYKVETKVIVADFGEKEDIYNGIKAGLEGLEIGVLGLYLIFLNLSLWCFVLTCLLTSHIEVY